MPDSALHLATAACNTGVVVIDSHATLSCNIKAAANAAIAHSLRNLDHDVRWWTSIKSSNAGGRENAENGEGQELCSEAAHSIVIEFSSAVRGRIEEASAVNASPALDRCESVCPGFTGLLYTILEKVSYVIWPFITPRTLWEHYRCDTTHEGATHSDADVAFGALYEYLDEEVIAKYGFTSIKDMTGNEAVSVYEEEVGDVLPSYFLKKFGRGAVGAWPLYNAKEGHESIPCPEKSFHTDLAIALQNMECRAWCPTAPEAIKALRCMHDIDELIKSGAMLASHTYIHSNPSFAAIHLWRFDNYYPKTNISEEDAFRRILDNAGRYAMESGETLNTPGWAVVDVDGTKQTQESLHRLEMGCQALNLCLDLVFQLFSENDD